VEARAARLRLGVVVSRPRLLPALLAALALAPAALAGDPPPATPSPPPPPAARVVAAVGRAAAENLALAPERRARGDALADLYVRRAATAAEGDVSAFLRGLAHALDPAATLAGNPLTRAAFAGLEAPEAAAARRRAMGEPTMRGRGDLLLHFFVSAALAEVAGAGIAAAAGTAKEMADLRTPSGFSFPDLLADDAGISFSAWLSGKDGAARLARLATAFVGADHLPDFAGLPEGVSAEAFARDYGTLSDPRYRARRREVSDRVAALERRREPARTPGTERGRLR
jgi:hypothetical protein